MNHFSTKLEVDNYVRNLQCIFKPKDDIYNQHLSVAKLYFAIKEFHISKNFLEKYLKIKPDSEVGLLLEVKIYEELKDNFATLKCYENLYHIFKRNNYIEKVCHYLVQCDIEEEKIKNWIDILESENIHTEQLSILKSRVYPENLIKELDKLRIKMKHDVNNQFKRQFFSILSNLKDVDQALKGCIDIVTHFDILDDGEIVTACVKIFQAEGNYRESHNRELYCILLIAFLKSNIIFDPSNCSQYLSELYDLLILDEKEKINMELRDLFLFFLISCAHSTIIFKTEGTEEIFRCLYIGYCKLRKFQKYFDENHVSKPVKVWLNRQSSYRLSIANHMVKLGTETLKDDIDIPDWFAKIGDIVQLTDEVKYESLRIMFEEKATNIVLDVNKIVEIDVGCYNQYSTDFSFIMWQLMCHLKPFWKTQASEFDIPNNASLFINSLVKTLFPNIPLRTLNTHCPQNISRVDIITFFLGAIFTYKKFIPENHLPLPNPFEWTKKELKPNISLMEKFWEAICDFLLNNKRNTSIGFLRDFLKSGLNLIQLSDNKLSETIKLQLGRSLFQFSCENKLEKEAIEERSLVFFFRAIETKQTVPSSLVISTRLPSFQSSFNSLMNLQNSSKSANDLVLFDTDILPDDILEEWRFEAYLCYISWKMKLENFINELEDIEDLVKEAEKIKSNQPQLLFLKSKIYFAKALNYGDKKQFRIFINSAERYANQCKKYLGLLHESKRSELEQLLQEQYMTIAMANDGSLRIFPDTESISNKIPLRSSKEFTTFSSFNNLTDFDIRANSESIEELEPKIDDIRSSNTDIVWKMDSCIQKYDGLKIKSQKDQYDIQLLKSQSHNHLNQYNLLLSEVENLTKKVEELSLLELKYKEIKKENEMIKYQMEKLVKNVEELETENLSLKINMNKSNRSFLWSSGSLGSRMDNLMKPQIEIFDEFADKKLKNIENTVKDHLKGFDNLQLGVLQTKNKKISPSKKVVKSDSNSKKDFTQFDIPNSNDIDFDLDSTANEVVDKNLKNIKDTVRNHIKGFNKVKSENISEYSKKKESMLTIEQTEDATESVDEYASSVDSFGVNNESVSGQKCVNVNPVLTAYQKEMELMSKTDDFIDFLQLNDGKWTCSTCKGFNNNYTKSCSHCSGPQLGFPQTKNKKISPSKKVVKSGSHFQNDFPLYEQANSNEMDFDLGSETIISPPNKEFLGGNKNNQSLSGDALNRDFSLSEGSSSEGEDIDVSV